MKHVISNNSITVITKDEGAELCSIKTNSDGLEYLWQADTAFWGRHAPVLFPIVGKLKDDRTVIEGKEYKMTQHGFARDMTFEVLGKTEKEITYMVEADLETKKRYPYNFSLFIIYSVEDNNVKVTYKIKNIDTKPILFSIGAHPGFNCPLVQGEAFEDYYLKFNSEELINSYRLYEGIVESKELVNKEKLQELMVSRQLFEKDALILENMNSSEVSLISTKSGRGVSVNFKGFPYLGLWSKPEGALFICIEPWYGIADFTESGGLFEDKKGIIKLMTDDEFVCSFVISVF